MKAKAPQKKYWEMTTQELAEATKEFDKEFVADTFHPMTDEQRVRWERIKRKPRRESDPKGLKNHGQID